MLKCIAIYIQNCLFLSISKVLKGGQFFANIEHFLESICQVFGANFIFGCPSWVVVVLTWRGYSMQ